MDKPTALLEALEKEHALIAKLDGIGNIVARCKAEERASVIENWLMNALEVLNETNTER